MSDVMVMDDPVRAVDVDWVSAWHQRPRLREVTVVELEQLEQEAVPFVVMWGTVTDEGIVYLIRCL